MLEQWRAFIPTECASGVDLTFAPGPAAISRAANFKSETPLESYIC